LRRQRWATLVLIIWTAFSYAQDKAKPKPEVSARADSERLPVKRVVLYKNGVGYFEHSARVHGNQDLGIDFTTGQLNDVLKSLTVFDLGDGRISVGTAQPEARAENAPAPPPPPAGPGEFRFRAGTGGGIGGALGPSGTLTGIVNDPSGAVIPGAAVTARNQQTGLSQTAATDNAGRYQLSVPAGNYDLSIYSAGFRNSRMKAYVGVGRTTQLNATLNLGSISETVEVNAVAAKLSPEAEARKIGDFFEYDLKQKITIGKNQSALVPILQSRVEAEKVTLLNAKDSDDEDSGQTPLRAIWIKNTSGQVLDSGTFNILDGDTFAGEGVLESIHPDERRLLSYAADNAVHVKHEEESSEKPYSRVKIAKGLMVLTKEERQTDKFDVRDADKTSRVVVLEYPAQQGWELTKDTPKPEESSPSFYRFRLPVEAGKTAQLTVGSVHPDETQYTLTNLNPDEVVLLSRQQRITPAMQQVFDKVLSQKSKIAELDQELNQRRQESDQISADQARIRENMKALKGTAEEKALLQRYTGELNSQEDRLAALRRELEDLRAKRNIAGAELDRIVMGITLDESF
jgi:hypothetical protein